MLPFIPDAPTPLFTLLQNIPLSDIQYIKIHNLDYPIFCPDCESEMTIKNSKRRYIKDCNSQKIPFNLKRYYCPNCNHLHTEIPNFVHPYRQYEQSVISEVKRGHIDTFSGDDSTIRYWQGKKQ